MMMSVSSTKSATGHKWVPAIPVQDLNQITEDVTSGHDELSQKLEVMLRMLVDLSSRVQATKDQQMEVVASPTASPSTSRPDGRRAAKCQLPLTASPVTFRPSRRAAKSQPSLNQKLDLPNEVRHRVAKMLRQLSIMTATTTDEDTTQTRNHWHLGTDDP